jgi:uncharacterized protein (DUF1800 family)/fibronectin type 3 domain-containing protein
VNAKQVLLTTAFISLAGIAAGAGGNGLKGEYFNNTGLLGSPVITRTDAAINFSWHEGGPGTGVAKNYFSVRWTGEVQAPATGDYTFTATVDDGMRVWVNNVEIINHWTSHGLTTAHSGPVALTAGQSYPIKVEYFENGNSATAKLAWDPPGSAPMEIIPQAQLFSPAAPPPGTLPTYLSTLNPTFAENGWGPYQRDRSNGERGEEDGHTITINGVKFARGLGVHARSELRYALAGKYTKFASFIGVDDEVGDHGSVVFQVWVDGTKAFESPILHGADPAKQVSVDVTGKNELKLIVLDGGDGNTYDHADWADASIFAAGGGSGDPTPPAVPTGLTATPGDKQITLAWTASKGAQTYNVYRGATAGGEATTAIATGITATSFLNTGLTNGTPYFYKITAVNGAGMSAPSNEANATPAVATPPPPPPVPTGLTATPGDKQIVLTWKAGVSASPVAGAGTPVVTYNIYRGGAAGAESTTPIATGVTGTSFTNTGLTNGTPYFYKVAAASNGMVSQLSSEATATPAPAAPPPAAPTGLTATPGDKQIVLAWTAVTGAATYNVYRGTTSGAEAATAIATGITGTTFTNTGLTNGTTYFYQVSATNAIGTGDKSAEASAKPAPPPLLPAPTGVTATPGNTQNVLAWNSVTGAVTYNVYRGATTGAEAATPFATGITGTTYTNTGLTNGTNYFYMVAAVNANGVGAKSTEVSAMPTAPGLQLSAAQKDAFRFLRQSTWGPNLAMVDHVVQVGKSTFIAEQVAAAQSTYPDALITMPNMELVSEQFFQNAMQGNDQLRQRVAWALSQIFVVSAVKVDNTHAMVPYIRMLHARAFDNVANILRDVTLSPAMGEFLDMVNNKKSSGGAMPNENYARELLQLFSIGLIELNDDGTPRLGSNGLPVATYDQSTVADLARAFTGWTYGDAKTTNPTTTNPPYYDGPMKPVAQFHDTGAKTILGTPFAAAQTAQQDLDQALALIFNHHNLGPFLVRELIQRLVTSNPSPKYISDVVAVFNNNGQGVRGDLNAVVSAILLHPEAVNGTPTSGKFSEPALFELTLARALGATVADHPILSDPSEAMSQRIWFAPSVFNYFSPNYRAGAIFAPEMQIWTTATAMTRTNFIASVISGGFGSNITIDYTPFNTVAADPNALLDTVDSRIMGGTMSASMRGAIVTALGSATGTTERVRTALYLAAASMQYQGEH